MQQTSHVSSGIRVADDVRPVEWEEYCALALSRKPLERVVSRPDAHPGLRDRESGKLYVVEGASRARAAGAGLLRLRDCLNDVLSQAEAERRGARSLRAVARSQRMAIVADRRWSLPVSLQLLLAVALLTYVN